MKVKIISLAICTLLSVTSVFAQSENRWIRRARCAAQECLSEFHGNNWNIHANLSNAGPCMSFGTMKEVVFYGVPDYDPQIDNHPPPLPIIIARVLFSCCGEIISVECN